MIIVGVSMLIRPIVVLIMVIFTSGCTNQSMQTQGTQDSPEHTNVINTIPSTPFENTNPSTLDKYQDYSIQSFQQSSTNKRVYFFYAKWCPTCKTAHSEFTNQSSQIPDDVIIFRTDYDTETELKKKYGITYQHTFVQVDDQGNELSKWNGGGLRELKNMVK